MVTQVKRRKRAINDPSVRSVDADSSANDSPPTADAPKGPQPAQWPDPPEEDAFHGLAGDIVRTIAPNTEADPVALLIQLLVMFGNIIGHAAHFVVEATIHYLNLFAVLTGATSKGRKGTSFDHSKRFFEGLDPTWSDEAIKSGLSSGEGLIFAIRDDPDAVTEKRLLVIESEFASILRMLGRDGSVLSAIIRQAWDSGNLRILTKNSPIAATGAHISLIGHISAIELRAELTKTESANGFGNRIMWFCVKRSNVLPEGGCVSQEALAPLKERLHQAIEYARGVGEIRRSEEARALWHEVYPALSEGRPTLAGSLTSRAEAQVTRLACLYALLDCSTTINVEHLRAALALHRYVEASVRFMFGDSLGNPMADQLLLALRNAGADGLTRTNIRDLFGRHAKEEDLQKALNVLLQYGLARRVKQETGGRPVDRYFAIGADGPNAAQGQSGPSVA